MYDSFFKSLDQKVPLNDVDRRYMESLFLSKRFKKGQYLLEEGDVCNYLFFVLSGAVKQYSTDKNGNIHIFQFAIEDWMVSDMHSFLTGKPSTYAINAVEDCEVLLIDKSAHENLLQLKVYETYIRQQLTGAYLAMQHRLTSNLSFNPEQKYSEFLANYPMFINRFPQHMIAAYLGLTPETLSRIRRKNVNK